MRLGEDRRIAQAERYAPPPALFSAVDLALLADYPGVPIVDGSSIDTWKKCRRRSWLTNPAPFGLGLRPARNALPLDFGRAFHEALDYVYATNPPRYSDAAAAFMARFDHIVAQIEAAVPNLLPGESVTLDEARTLGVAMLAEWAEWAPERDDFEVVATEAPLLVPIRDPLSGAVIALYYLRIDGLVRDRKGRLWLREYKTTAKWWSPTFLEMSDQVKRYCWAIKQRLGEAPRGVLFDFFLKHAAELPTLLKNGRPSTNLRTLAYTTAAQYRRTLDACGFVWRGSPYQEALSALREREEEGHPTLRRTLVEPSAYAVEQVGERLAKTVGEMLRSVAGDEPDTEPTADLIGCSQCSVQAICRVYGDEPGSAWRSLASVTHAPAERMWDSDLNATKKAMHNDDDNPPPPTPASTTGDTLAWGDAFAAALARAFAAADRTVALDPLDA